MKKRITQKGMCSVYADKLYTQDLTRSQIYDVLTRIWDVADAEGWQRRLSESRMFKDRKKALKKEDWGKHRDEIEDLIHGGIKTKKA